MALIEHPAARTFDRQVNHHKHVEEPSILFSHHAPDDDPKALSQHHDGFQGPRQGHRAADHDTIRTNLGCPDQWKWQRQRTFKTPYLSGLRDSMEVRARGPSRLCDQTAWLRSASHLLRIRDEPRAYQRTGEHQAFVRGRRQYRKRIGRDEDLDSEALDLEHDLSELSRA